MASKMKKAKSLYQRHGKAPYKYSDIYQQWKACKLKGDERGADDAARRHYNRFVRFADAEPETRHFRYPREWQEAA